MENLRLEHTETSPFVNLSKENNEFQMEGVSYMEDSYSFFDPIIKWLQEYGKTPNLLTTFEFKFRYINTSSTKQVTKILLELEKIGYTHKVKVDWYYMMLEDGPDDLEKSGQRFQHLMSLDIELKEWN